MLGPLLCLPLHLPPLPGLLLQHEALLETGGQAGVLPCLVPRPGGGVEAGGGGEGPPAGLGGVAFAEPPLHGPPLLLRLPLVLSGLGDNGGVDPGTG